MMTSWTEVDDFHLMPSRVSRADAMRIIEPEPKVEPIHDDMGPHLQAIRDAYEQFLRHPTIIAIGRSAPPDDFKTWLRNQTRDIARWDEVFE